MLWTARPQRGRGRRRGARESEDVVQEERWRRVGRALAMGRGKSWRRAVDSASAEQSARILYFAMPLPPSALPWRCLSHFAGALFRASPALFLPCPRPSLPFRGITSKTQTEFDTYWALGKSVSRNRQVSRVWSWGGGGGEQ